MPLFTGSAKLTFDCDIHPDKESVRQLLARRYAGTSLKYGKVSGSRHDQPAGKGFYYATVSGTFSSSIELLDPGTPAQRLTQTLHYSVIEAMFLAEPDEILECSECFQWLQPIDIGPFIQAHPLS